MAAAARAPLESAGQERKQNLRPTENHLQSIHPFHTKTYLYLSYCISFFVYYF